MPVFGECKNSSKFGVVWGWRGRNQDSRLIQVLGIYSWGLIPGRSDCNEQLVTEKSQQRQTSPFSGFLQFTRSPAMKVYLKWWGRQRSLSDSSKLSFPGENFFPATTNDTRDRVSRAKQEQRVAQMVPALLDPQGRKKRVGLFCLPWLAVPGARRISLVGQDSFSRVKGSSPRKWIFMPLTSVLTGPTSVVWQVGIWSSAGFSFLHFAIPQSLFFPVILVYCAALLGKTQEMARAWAANIERCTRCNFAKIRVSSLASTALQEFLCPTYKA